MIDLLLERGPSQAKLIAVGKRNAGTEIPISTPNFVIGRGHDCQFHVRSNQISWRHCIVSVGASAIQGQWNAHRWQGGPTGDSYHRSSRKIAARDWTQPGQRSFANTPGKSFAQIHDVFAVRLVDRDRSLTPMPPPLEN